MRPGAQRPGCFRVRRADRAARRGYSERVAQTEAWPLRGRPLLRRLSALTRAYRNSKALFSLATGSHRELTPSLASGWQALYVAGRRPAPQGTDKTGAWYG